MPTITDWHHVAIQVPEIEKSEEWYLKVFQADVFNRIGWDPRDIKAGRNRAVWLQVGDAIINLAEADVIDRPEEAHFFHYALAAPPGTLDDWIDHLRRIDVEVYGPFGHGRTSFVSIYFDDPDNYRWEIVVDYGDYETAKREALARGGMLGNPSAPYVWE